MEFSEILFQADFFCVFDNIRLLGITDYFKGTIHDPKVNKKVDQEPSMSLNLIYRAFDIQNNGW